MQISNCCHQNSNKMIANKFCTWHNSAAALSCVKICSDLADRYWIKTRLIFYQISYYDWKTLSEMDDWCSISLWEMWSMSDSFSCVYSCTLTSPGLPYHHKWLIWHRKILHTRHDSTCHNGGAYIICHLRIKYNCFPKHNKGVEFWTALTATKMKVTKKCIIWYEIIYFKNICHWITHYFNYYIQQQPAIIVMMMLSFQNKCICHVVIMKLNSKQQNIGQHTT